MASLITLRAGMMFGICWGDCGYLSGTALGVDREWQ